MFAEGMVDDPTPSHPHAEDIVSTGWGSYFYYPLPARQKVTSTRAGSAFLHKAPSFDSQTTGNGNNSQLPPRAPSVQKEEMNRAITLRRVSSMKTAGDAMAAASLASAGFAAAAADARGESFNATSSLQRQRRSGSHCGSHTANVSEPPSRGSTPSITSHIPNDGTTSVGLPGYGITNIPASNPAAIRGQAEEGVVKGPKRINTLWGTYVRDYAKMCIPDVDVLVDYPIDYEFPTFHRDKHGDIVESGFFPSDPLSLHAEPSHFIQSGPGPSNQATSMSGNVSISRNQSRRNSSFMMPQGITTLDSSNNNNNGDKNNPQ